MGELQERITSTRTGSITSMQAVYVPADDYTDPAPATTFAHLDASISLERKFARYQEVFAHRQTVRSEPGRREAVSRSMRRWSPHAGARGAGKTGRGAPLIARWSCTAPGQSRGVRSRDGLLPR